MVYILLSTYNGEKYLEEQLESLINQQNIEFKILVRDDGSTDGTIDILNKWHNNGLLTWYSGENIGVVNSFMDLLKKAPKSDYYAFCDQDDIWLPDKLYRGICSLEEKDGVYKLYATAYQMVDANLNPIPTTMTPAFRTFGESLLITPVPGCTMIFNHNLLKLFIKADANQMSMHDSWMYKLCLGVGGVYIYDDKPSILYRQHGNNLIGGKQSRFKRWTRRWRNLIHANCYRSRNAIHLLEVYNNELVSTNKTLLQDILLCRNSFVKKIKVVLSPNYRSKNIINNVLFKIAIILNRY